MGGRTHLASLGSGRISPVCVLGLSRLGAPALGSLLPFFFLLLLPLLSLLILFELLLLFLLFCLLAPFLDLLQLLLSGELVSWLGLAEWTSTFVPLLFECFLLFLPRSLLLFSQTERRWLPRCRTLGRPAMVFATFCCWVNAGPGRR